MKRGQRQALLEHVADGYDVEAACAKLGIPIAQISRAGPKLKADIQDAYRVATARLRARVTELALRGDDAGMLARILDKRDEAQARMAGPEGKEFKFTFVLERPERPNGLHDVDNTSRPSEQESSANVTAFPARKG